MPPKVFLSQMFCTTGLVSSKYVAQMYEEEIHFRNCYFNKIKGFGRFDPVTLTFDLVTPKLIDNRVLLLPRMYVWTKLEESRSKRSRVIDRKRKGYRRTDSQTDMCKAICPLLFEGGHNNHS